MITRTAWMGVALLAAACSDAAELGTNSTADTSSPATASTDAAPRADEVGPGSYEAAPRAAEPASAAKTTDVPSIDRSHRGVVEVLGEVLIAVGRLDDVPITAVTYVTRCRTDFTSGKRRVGVDWSKVPDFQSSVENGRLVTPINDGGGAHLFSVPEAKQPEPAGNAAARVEGAFSTLVDGCSGG